MPLNLPSLQSALEDLFSNPPPAAADCAQAWADAVEAYFSGVVPPSTTVSAAAGVMTGALQTAFEAPNAAPAVDGAFTAFATTVAGGMLPAFTGVPPAAPLAISTLLAAPQPTHAAAAAAFSALIDTWARTGTAALVAPPFTASLWS
jgi:hypothetical protein